MTDRDQEEALLRASLDLLHKQFKDAAAPIIERLAYIEACKPPPTFIVCGTCYNVMIRDQPCHHCEQPS